MVVFLFSMHFHLLVIISLLLHYNIVEHLPWELVYDKEAVPTQGETQPHGDNI